VRPAEQARDLADRPATSRDLAMRQQWEARTEAMISAACPRTRHRAIVR
jgi:hypothetical protein